MKVLLNMWFHLRAKKRGHTTVRTRKKKQKTILEQFPFEAQNFQLETIQIPNFHNKIGLMLTMP